MDNPDKKSITIFINAHGEDRFFIDAKVPEVLIDKDIHVFSLAGAVGGAAYMTRCIDNDEPLAIRIMRYIKQNYSDPRHQSHLLYEPNYDPQLSALRHARAEIPPIYSRCNPSIEAKFAYLHPPRTDKNYFIRPALHENCDKCIENGDSRCTPLPPDEIQNPEYGITVIESSDPADAEYTLMSGRVDFNPQTSIYGKTGRLMPFTNLRFDIGINPPVQTIKGITLEGTKVEDPETHLRQIVNWNYPYDGGRPMATYRYWQEKALAKATTKDEYVNILNTIYLIMGWMDDTIIMRDKKRVPREPRETVRLSEIVQLFKTMGFTKIYIIDNSCRTCGVKPGEPGAFYETVCKVIQGRKEAMSPRERQQKALCKLIYRHKPPANRLKKGGTQKKRTIRNKKRNYTRRWKK